MSAKKIAKLNLESWLQKKQRLLEQEVSTLRSAMDNAKIRENKARISFALFEKSLELQDSMTN